MLDENTVIDITEESDTPAKKSKRKVTLAELDNVKNYLAIELSYNLSFILPYKEGVALLASFEHAEKVAMPTYSNKSMLFDHSPLEIKSFIVSQQEYRKHKMDALLGVTDE